MKEEEANVDDKNSVEEKNQKKSQHKAAKQLTLNDIVAINPIQPSAIIHVKVNNHLIDINIPSIEQDHLSLIWLKQQVIQQYMKETGQQIEILYFTYNSCPIQSHINIHTFITIAAQQAKQQAKQEHLQEEEASFVDVTLPNTLTAIINIKQLSMLQCYQNISRLNEIYDELLAYKIKNIQSNTFKLSLQIDSKHLKYLFYTLCYSNHLDELSTLSFESYPIFNHHYQLFTTMLLKNPSNLLIKSITHLNVANTSLTNLKFIHLFTSCCQSLNLSYNHLNSSQIYFKTFLQLHTLNVANCNITHLDVSNLKQLKELNVSCNPLQSLSFLNDISSSIEILNLSNIHIIQANLFIKWLSSGIYDVNQQHADVDHVNVNQQQPQQHQPQQQYDQAQPNNLHIDRIRLAVTNLKKLIINQCQIKSKQDISHFIADLIRLNVKSLDHLSILYYYAWNKRQLKRIFELLHSNQYIHILSISNTFNNDLSDISLIQAFNCY